MVNQTLTNLYKNILKTNGLVDSGDLIKSIIVDMYLKNNTLFINIKSLEYLIYLTDKYKLTKQFIDNQVFEEQIELAFKPIIEKQFQDIIDNEQSNFKLSLTLLYNGK